MNWQPIETAPKETVYVDGQHAFGAKILVAMGDSVFRARWWSHGEADNFLDDGGSACYPSHWMPLPDPPQ